MSSSESASLANPSTAAGTGPPAGAGRWTFGSGPSRDWSEAVRRCGGGFFHSPLALGWAAPAGTPLFARYVREGETEAVGVGVRRRCRVGIGADHAYFPSVPATRGGASREVLSALVRAVRSTGGAELVVDSFDATASLAGAGGDLRRARVEYRVRIDLRAEDRRARLGSTLRRRIAQGDRAGWELRRLDETEWSARLAAGEAGRRRRKRLAGSDLPPAAAPVTAAGESDASRQGVAVFAAFDGDTMLSVAMVGWAETRAFYLRGGSTAEGYRRSAAGWLHWRILGWLADRGCTLYSLGGTGAHASDPDDAEHGLYRFKTAFGPEIVGCQGAAWSLRPIHLATHRCLRRFAEAFTPGGRDE